MVRIWDTARTELVLTLPAHDDRIRCLAFSPDGTLLVTRSSDGTARLWDTVPRAARLAGE